jgi:putative ABC transport system substrate-binding protein
MLFGRLKRREFITLLGGAAAAWPLTARTQQRTMPVVGVLSSRSPLIDIPLMAVIREGLSGTGFVEGQSVAFDYRYADGQYERLPALAADLVHSRVTVILTIGGEAAALAAKAATATVPIVCIIGTDGVQIGLVASVARPGGNLTGVSTSFVELEPKRLELIRELLPKSNTITLLINPNEPFAEMQASDVQAAARTTGRNVTILRAGTILDIDAAFANLAEMRADALLIATNASSCWQYAIGYRHYTFAANSSPPVV